MRFAHQLRGLQINYSFLQALALPFGSIFPWIGQLYVVFVAIYGSQFIATFNAMDGTGSQVAPVMQVNAMTQSSFMGKHGLEVTAFAESCGVGTDLPHCNGFKTWPS